MATAAGTRTPAQMFALVFGVVYVLVGILGFFATGFDNFSSNGDDTLIIFEVNPLHNIVHLLIGAVWVGAATTHAAAKSMNTLLGVAYLLVFLLGIFGAAEWLSIDDGVVPDDILHLLSGALSLYFGTAGAEGTRAATA